MQVSAACSLRAFPKGFVTEWRSPSRMLGRRSQVDMPWLQVGILVLVLVRVVWGLVRVRAGRERWPPFLRDFGFCLAAASFAVALWPGSEKPRLAFVALGSGLAILTGCAWHVHRRGGGSDR